MGGIRENGLVNAVRRVLRRLFLFVFGAIVDCALRTIFISVWGEFYVFGRTRAFIARVLGIYGQNCLFHPTHHH